MVTHSALVFAIKNESFRFKPSVYERIVLQRFYDWYCDLPPSSPQIWGQQTDVPESADWYESTYMIVWGTNLPMTRTPDAHFFTEARYNGSTIVCVSPDYSPSAIKADLWVPLSPGTQ